MIAQAFLADLLGGGAASGSAGGAAGAAQLGCAAILPTLIAHGSAAQRAAYAPGLESGEAIWTVMLAEPGPGFAVEALETVATRDGDGWRISGKKIWCRAADRAGHGVLLAGTDDDAACATCFIVDLPAPGIRILPIPLASGRDMFDEVLLDGLWVSDDARLGPVGAGWAVSQRLRDLAPLRLDIQARAAAASLLAGRSCPEAVDLARLSALDAALHRLELSTSAPDHDPSGVDRAVAEMLARRLIQEVARLRHGAAAIDDVDAIDLAAAEYQLENGPTHQFMNRLGAALLGSDL